MTTETRTMDGADVHKAFMSEVLESLPGFLLVISVAVFAHFAAPLLLRFEFFKTYLTIKDFILAILVGIAIRNTVGVPGILQPGLRFSTILTKTGIVVMGAKYSLAGLVTVGGHALGPIALVVFPPLGRLLELSDTHHGAFAGVGVINSAPWPRASCRPPARGTSPSWTGRDQYTFLFEKLPPKTLKVFSTTKIASGS
ncbi:putative sulfate exporter family transporter [Desulfovibrio sp. Fe33]|uniref:putative sulfate exporter family transporter n=1 Tax=Desulfovibrio sp. Fe33 TaxID=3020842 RepID=UPI003FA491D8